MKVLKGSVVKLNSGETGMIVFRRSNEDMAINIQHYHLAVCNPHNSVELRTKLLTAIKNGQYGCDKEISKTEIEKVITL